MTPLENTALDRLAAGDISLGCGIRISTSPAVVRTLAAAGFDWLFIDLEHGTLSIETCAQLSAAALTAGIAPLVRVPPRQHWLATRALEGGALGIVMPDVANLDEARALAAVTKFPPVGERNVGGPPVQTAYRPLPREEMTALLNRVTLTVAMIETPDALARVGDIAAVDGIDVVMIGGNDLSATMGIPGRTGDASMAAAFDDLIAACRSAGKYAGMGGVNDNAQIEAYVKKGVRFILAGSDTTFLANAAHNRVAALRELDRSG